MFTKGLLHVLFKRKNQILVFFLATLLVAVPFALMSNKAKYEATSQLRLELGREYVSDLRLDTLGAVSPVVRFNPDEQLDLAIEILRGHSLALKVVKEMGVDRLYPGMDAPSLGDKLLPAFLTSPHKKLPEEAKQRIAADLLIDDLTASKTAFSSIINIGYAHTNPQIAAETANRLVELFIDRHLEIRSDARTDQFFRQQFDKIKNNLQAAEQEMRAFRSEHGISSTVSTEKEQLILQISRLQAELNDTTSKYSELENRIAQILDQIENTAQDPSSIALLKEKLVNLQIKENELQVNYNRGSRTLDNLRAEIKAVQLQLAKLGGNKRYGSTGGAGSGSLYNTLQADLLKAQTDLSAAAARKEVTSEQIAALNKRLNVLDDIDVPFSELEQRVKVAKENYALYLNRFEEMRISNAMDDEKISSISVIEPARVPLESMKSKLPLQIGLAIAVGLIGGLGIAFLLELLNKTIERREDIEDGSGLPVLASVPDFSKVR